jgi:hypothetical protein
MGTAAIINDMSGKSPVVIDSTHCVNKVVLCSGSNDVEYISEIAFTSINGQTKKSVDPTL